LPKLVTALLYKMPWCDHSKRVSERDFIKILPQLMQTTCLAKLENKAQTVV